jgi:membrane protein implicated in regulation of membrane protease activity
MNTRAIIYLGSSLICIIIALVIFYNKFYTFIAFIFLIIVVVAVLLFRQGLTEMKKKKE